MNAVSSPSAVHSSRVQQNALKNVHPAVNNDAQSTPRMLVVALTACEIADEHAQTGTGCFVG